MHVLCRQSGLLDPRCECHVKRSWVEDMLPFGDHYSRHNVAKQQVVPHLCCRPLFACYLGSERICFQPNWVGSNGLLIQQKRRCSCGMGVHAEKGGRLDFATLATARQFLLQSVGVHCRLLSLHHPAARIRAEQVNCNLELKDNHDEIPIRVTSPGGLKPSFFRIFGR